MIRKPLYQERERKPSISCSSKPNTLLVNVLWRLTELPLLASVAGASETDASQTSVSPGGPTSNFDPETMRKTKPGFKRLILTLSTVFSFLLGFPVIWKTIEIYRAPLLFKEIESFSAQLETNPLKFPCHLQAIFIGFDSKSMDAEQLESSITRRITELNSKSSQRGSCGSNYNVSVVIDADTDCVQTRKSKALCLWRCGAISAANFGDGMKGDDDDAAIDEMIENVLGGCLSSSLGGGKLYTVLVVNGEEEKVRATVGKYRHSWIVGRISKDVGVSMVAEIFVKVFVNVENDEGLIHGEFMPVGADGKIVLSFSLLNADPQDWIYDWNFHKIDKSLLSPVLEAMQPISDITIESQVLYHTPKSSFSYWDAKHHSYIFSTKDLPFFVNSNEWHLDTSVAAGGRSKILQVVVSLVIDRGLEPFPHVYSRGKWHKGDIFQLPKGEFSDTNGFISPMWGGVIVWNPEGCLKGSARNGPVRHMISQEDLGRIFQVLMGQLRQLFGLKSHDYFDGASGTFTLLRSDKGFTEWELDVLSRQHACFNLHSSATTLGSLSRLVQSLPRMIIKDEIGKQSDNHSFLSTYHHSELVKISLEMASLALSNASSGVYDASAASSRQSRSLAEDAFFHPSIMSVSYYSFEHCFAVYSPFFLPVLMHVIMAALREFKRYKHENRKYLAWKAKEQVTV